MATYEVTAPDGSVLQFDGPDDATQEQLLNYAKAQWAAQAKGSPSTVLRAQLSDPNRDPGSTPELLQEIKRREAAAGPATPQPQPFAAPRASQADVRKSEPQPTPMEDQAEKEARFDDAMHRYTMATGGTIPPGKNIRQAVEEWSGIQDPMKTRESAQLDELANGGDLQYGDSVPYAAAKGLASIGGFALGGPGAATVTEGAVRAVAIAANLKKAVDAGAIDEDQAATIMSKEMAKGYAEDAAFNVAAPVVGRVLGALGKYIVSKVPGAQSLVDKAVAKLGASGMKFSGLDQQLADQRARALASRQAEAQTPEAKQAVEELVNRSGGAIPTPSQVTGDSSYAENAARIAQPTVFENAQKQLEGGAESLRQDTLNPAGQPRRPVLGQMVIDNARDLVQATKNRLRPIFEEADRLGTTVDLSPVVARAKAALAKDAATPAGLLEPRERQYLKQLIDDIEATAPKGTPAGVTTSPVLGPNGQPITTAVPAQPGGPIAVSPEATLDLLSRQKETLRDMPDYKPSSYYKMVVGQMEKDGDAAYNQAAASIGRGDVAKRLLGARNDYRETMSTVYDDAVEQALRKNPEDIGRLFWQSGNVSELRQLQGVMALSQREGKMSQKDIVDLSRAMARGFLQEAVPTVDAAAKWSETLAAKPGLRDTWDTITSAPGGEQLRNGMKVLEQAAQIAQRGNREMVGESTIFLQRAAKGGLGISYVTGVIHPGFLVAGVSAQAMTRLMATAYTQGNKGAMNAAMRFLRANGTGTAAGAKAAQAALPVIERFAADNHIDDIFTYAGMPGVSDAQ